MRVCIPGRNYCVPLPVPLAISPEQEQVARERGKLRKLERLLSSGARPQPGPVQQPEQLKGLRTNPPTTPALDFHAPRDIATSPSERLLLCPRSCACPGRRPVALRSSELLALALGTGSRSGSCTSEPVMLSPRTCPGCPWEPAQPLCCLLNTLRVKSSFADSQVSPGFVRHILSYGKDTSCPSVRTSPVSSSKSPSR
jgi:hypothetical protein